MKWTNKIADWFRFDRKSKVEQNKEIFPDLLETKTIPQIKKLTPQQSYKNKKNAKHSAKRKIPKKFRLSEGETYILKFKSKDKSKEFLNYYRCVKVIYSISDNPVNIVIMKKISGELNNNSFLNREDCKKFHIKYESGLEVWRQNHNWIKVK